MIRDHKATWLLVLWPVVSSLNMFVLWLCKIGHENAGDNNIKNVIIITLFARYLEISVSRPIFTMADCVTERRCGKMGLFFSTQTPLSGFLSEGCFISFFLSFFFFFQGLSTLLLSHFTVMKIIYWGFLIFVCIFASFWSKKKKTNTSQDCLAFLLAFCGGLRWRHFTILSKWCDLVLFYVMETFQDS